MEQNSGGRVQVSRELLEGAKAHLPGIDNNVDAVDVLGSTKGFIATNHIYMVYRFRSGFLIV